MRRCDPSAKSVVFSAWSRVLRLAAAALNENGIEYLTIVGGAGGLSARADTIARFQKDPSSPKVMLILMSTGGRLEL